LERIVLPSGDGPWRVLFSFKSLLEKIRKNTIKKKKKRIKKRNGYKNTNKLKVIK
jgi:hypothetical protein